MSLRAKSPGPRGVTSLRAIGIDHYHDDEWEATYPAGDTEFLDDMIRENDDPWAPYPIDTLISGPRLHAIRVATSLTEDGDAGDYELRFFSSEADAIAASKKACPALFEKAVES